jgi:YD repeat-containing protein
MAGNRVRYTDGRGNAFVSTYNTWNLLESQIEPSTTAYPNLDDRKFTLTYDANGRVVTRTSPGNVAVTNSYNSMGYLSGQTGTGAEAATTSRSFGYDLAGRMTSASAPGGMDTFGYDDRGLLLSTAGPSGASSFAYNGDALMTSRTDAAGTSSYGYDTAGRLSTIADPSTGSQVAYTYNTLNQLSKVTYGGANVRWFGYDGRHRLTSDALKTSGGTRGHMFDNGNKRTAQAVVEQLMRRNNVISGPTSAELRGVIDSVGKGKLSSVRDISRALRGY